MMEYKIGNMEETRERFIEYLNNSDDTVMNVAKHTGISDSVLNKFKNKKNGLSPERCETLNNYLSQENKPTKHHKTKKGKAEAIGVRGSARTIAQLFKRQRNYKTDTDAASVLIYYAYNEIARKGIDSIDFGEYEVCAGISK